MSSVDTEKKARLLSKHRGELIAAASSKPDSGVPVPEPLGVHIQVNTSGEAEKSGCEPGAATVALAQLVASLPHLRLLGLMTIGAIARSVASGAGGVENEDFVCLCAQRDLVAAELKRPETELELSMGMSEDFEGAIALGSGEVRVGSTIFGARGPKSEAKIKE